MTGQRKLSETDVQDNVDTDGFIIEVSVDTTRFNGWDPSPVKRRDLDPRSWIIESSAADIPLRYPLVSYSLAGRGETKKRSACPRKASETISPTQSP